MGTLWREDGYRACYELINWKIGSPPTAPGENEKWKYVNKVERYLSDIARYYEVGRDDFWHVTWHGPRIRQWVELLASLNGWPVPVRQLAQNESVNDLRDEIVADLRLLAATLTELMGLHRDHAPKSTVENLPKLINFCQQLDPYFEDNTKPCYTF